MATAPRNFAAGDAEHVYPESFRWNHYSEIVCTSPLRYSDLEARKPKNS
jgi:hypothetical protein